MREWRNWRYAFALEADVLSGVWVRVPPFAPNTSCMLFISALLFCLTYNLHYVHGSAYSLSVMVAPWIPNPIVRVQIFQAMKN